MFFDKRKKGKVTLVLFSSFMLPRHLTLNTFFLNLKHFSFSRFCLPLRTTTKKVLNLYKRIQYSGDLSTESPEYGFI